MNKMTVWTDTIRNKLRESKYPEFADGHIVPKNGSGFTVVAPELGHALVGGFVIENQWEFYGRIYGFPECCVNAFVERIRQDEKPPYNPIQLSHSIVRRGYGFVPCLGCAATKTEVELTEEIAERRLFSKPFPQDGIGEMADIEIVNLLVDLDFKFHIGRTKRFPLIPALEKVECQA